MATNMKHPLEVANHAAAQPVPKGMVVVTEEAFFARVGAGNIHPSFDGKYATDWLEANSRRRVGRSLPGYVNPGEPKVWMLNGGQV